LSPLISIRLAVAISLLAGLKYFTCVNQLALCMQIVEGKKNLHETCLQEILRESMIRVAIEKIPKKLSHMGFWTR